MSKLQIVMFNLLMTLLLACVFVGAIHIGLVVYTITMAELPFMLAGYVLLAGVLWTLFNLAKGIPKCSLS